MDLINNGISTTLGINCLGYGCKIHAKLVGVVSKRLKQLVNNVISRYRKLLKKAQVRATGRLPVHAEQCLIQFPPHHREQKWLTY